MNDAKKRGGKGLSALAGGLAEGMASTWTLLSETTVYLSRAGILQGYENQLKEWRFILTSRKNDREGARLVREGLVLIRKNLRSDGHDLALGAMTIVFEGFRDDSCMREGFERLVILIDSGELFYIIGQDNHRALASYLDARYAKQGSDRAREYHYLWFMRQGRTIRLSGSDTEGREDFDRLQSLYAAKPLILLRGLKGLR